MTPPLSFLPVGAIFQGHYQVIGALSEGGMGAVYEVVHLQTQRRRALKIMLPELVSDATLRERFKLEATITANIDTEHIVETFDAGVDAATGAPYLVMELLKGEDLGVRLLRSGPVPVAEVVVLLHQAALALDKVHAAGIVHRDLKPENLYVTRRDDGSPRLKILDFGIAKIVSQGTKAKATQSMGTPLYMSPEQLQGDGNIGPRADLYSLAHIAYTILVGQGYWEPDALAVDGVYPLLVRIMQGAREPATKRAAGRGVTLPAGFDAWFKRATAIAPKDRFSTATELVAGLAAALNVPVPRPALMSIDPDAMPTKRRPPPLSEPTRVSRSENHTHAAVSSTSPGRRSRELRVPVLIGVSVLGLGIAGGAWFATRPSATDATAPPALVAATTSLAPTATATDPAGDVLAVAPATGSPSATVAPSASVSATVAPSASASTSAKPSASPPPTARPPTTTRPVTKTSKTVGTTAAPPVDPTKIRR